MADWESTRRAYDAMARAYHERYPDLRAEQPLDRAMIAAFAEYVRDAGDPEVLDAGCGTGRLITPLRDLGLVVTGVDLSPGMLAMARSVHPDVVFAAADLRRMPFPNRRFGGVVAWYSLINCGPTALAEALAEIERVLRPGGHVITGFQAGVGSRIQSNAYTDGYELERYLRTSDEMAAAFEGAGLTVLAQASRAMERDTADGEFDQSSAESPSDAPGPRCAGWCDAPGPVCGRALGYLDLLAPTAVLIMPA